ncbi:hypothetical protein SteCoe_3024 [Stentor coeruleus]|uniref:T-cell immunomodulatory protein TIP C2 domain-containing protein n=1 Tax=Stentor coeruleus TaxID=5963 RepID=A0A1R2CY76_9CILI|nr:hypothetical protein SteCoe_3024 [Stentor coeruleus]
MLLSAFGYFNKDKYCDMILLDNEKNSLQVFIWDNSELQFVSDSKLYYTVNGTVQNVIPGDIDFDGSLDILITYTYINNTFMQVVLQNNGAFSAQPAIEIPNNSQPVIMDLNGDLLLEVLNNKNQGVAIYKFSDSLKEAELLNDHIYTSNTSEWCLSYESLQVSYPHSIAFVDLNKDCLADLFLTVIKDNNLYFEVWLNAKDGLYCRRLSELAPKGTQQVSFADIDRNGVEDLVFAVCLGNNCAEKNEIHIVYNYNDVSNDCSFSRKSFEDFKLIGLGSDVSANDNDKEVITIASSFYKAEDDIPITIRFGDFNLDGYPDALITVFNASEGSSSAMIEILENKNCESCGKAQRTLEIHESNEFDKMRNIKGAVFACFFDLDDNGILDIIVVSKNQTNYKITGFYNNFLNDAFHLKALALNGKSKGGYSSAFPGAVFMFTLTELDMKKVILHSTQMPMTGFYSLNTPYCVYGLGRTNSYIEEFYVALPLNSSNFKSWTPIIPNSYLIASPVKDNTDEWFLELFASPTDKIGIIIGVCCGCMVLIGLVVIINYWREKREDKALFGIRF